MGGTVVDRKHEGSKNIVGLSLKSAILKREKKSGLHNSMKMVWPSLTALLLV